MQWKRVPSDSLGHLGPEVLLLGVIEDGWEVESTSRDRLDRELGEFYFTSESVDCDDPTDFLWVYEHR